MKPSEAIKQYGWCQNRFRGIDGEYCLSRVVAEYSPEQYRRVLDAIPFSIEYIKCLIDYNDTPGRTKEEVIALLESVGL